jgi:REP element-mobilizing transposase RayT
MPNHIHLLLVILDDEELRAIRESPLRGRSALSKMMGYLKMNVSKEIHRQNGGEPVWQRGFHDHIIRDREDHERHLKYVSENPIYWQSDELYCEE